MDDTISLTRQQFLVRMKRYAVGFQKMGIKLGDRICVHLDNSVENLTALFGLVITGATVVLANASLTESKYNQNYRLKKVIMFVCLRTPIV